jgi:UDP-N-acetylglucosamine 2-epimerase (non-hydrolysing)
VTDAISDMLFTPSKDGDVNLIREGVDRNKIHLVGNIMIDSLLSILKRIDKPYEDKILEKFALRREDFVLVTLHRPSNVDDKDNLWQILNVLSSLSLRIPVIFPAHPRTRKSLNGFEANFCSIGKFKIMEPLRYKEFIALERYAKFVLTDSGGIQEETTYLNVPCLTLRSNTERPITITQGTNELVSLENVEERIKLILSGSWKQGKKPVLWDGESAKRIVAILKKWAFDEAA